MNLRRGILYYFNPGIIITVDLGICMMESNFPCGVYLGNDEDGWSMFCSAISVQGVGRMPVIFYADLDGWQQTENRIENPARNGRPKGSKLQIITLPSLISPPPSQTN
ncbi:MAG: hypothetical protein A3A33_02530 [Candidatus Yanofskybacteria bacterium RIFCSPLOWO2_01_FULL_49_25]|uniref:Uncharacterized protein n=1 Tax=Candidatus Yanofskybacteria bacterium RIFCSPLOWO2_01_FULL_49_25 TaxID=1802701 RepID=A0A1F8GS05_9BACT|nr:MAG: hypothetical protein A3A33_02530 [Candidatus Yanofskybacteria bacterium RIFCSPLOWO2_01_FULL_49_25]